MKKTVLTRRDFLRGVAGGAAGLVLTAPRPGASLAPQEAAAVPATVSGPASRAVLVRRPDVLDAAGNVDDAVLASMLDDGVCALLDRDEPGECWRMLLRPDDVLGIKTNVWQNLPTPAALEQAVRARALAVGIPDERISIRDRGLLDDPVFTGATALVNMRPLRTHHWAGIGGCLKNYITFVREPFRWHDDSCADLGGLHKLPICAGKTRLHVLVVLTPLFYGIGPHHYDPQHVWPYRGLLLSTDPVAVDALGVELLARKRRRFFERPPRGGTSTKHVRLAEERHGVGVANLDHIALVKLGWMEDCLL